MKKILNSRLNFLNIKGFTLIELSIYMGILATLLLILTRFFIAALDAQIESQTTSSVAQDGRFILSRLTYDVTNADSLVIPSVIEDEGANLQIVKNSINYSYSLNGDNLIITNDNGTDVLNSPETKISNLKFKRIGNSGGKPTVQIKLTVTSAAIKRSGVDKQDFQTTIGLR